MDTKSQNTIIRKRGRTKYTKQKNGKTKKTYTFQYLNNKNKIVSDKNTIKHIKSIHIPPAYNNVIINKKKTHKIQAIGTDDKGRKQYIYNPRFIKANQNNKYKNIVKLGKNIEKIKRDVRKTLLDTLHSNKKPSEWDKQTNIAIIVFLLDTCNFRIGNSKYMKLYDSYGASTLKGKHINIRNNTVHITFIGKKGVFNSSIVKDDDVVKLLKMLKSRKKPDDLLFTTNGTLVSPEMVSSYLQQYDEDITPKMFRTWYANYYFLDKIRNDMKNRNEYLVNMLNAHHMIKRNTKKQFDKYKTKYINQCCDYIAENLHNTANISKKSYLDYQLVELFINNPHKFIDRIKQKNNVPNHRLLMSIINRMNEKR